MADRDHDVTLNVWLLVLVAFVTGALVMNGSWVPAVLGMVLVVVQRRWVAILVAEQVADELRRLRGDDEKGEQSWPW